MLEITNVSCYDTFMGNDGQRHCYTTEIDCAVVKIDGKIEKIIVPAASGYDCEYVYAKILTEEEFLKQYMWERVW